MDAETRAEIRVIKERMKVYEDDSRQLIRITDAVKNLAKKVDRYSLAITGLSTAVVADIIVHTYIK